MISKTNLSIISLAVFGLVLQPVFALDSVTERHTYWRGILKFEKDMNYDCNLNAEQSITSVNATSPLNPSSGTIFVKLAGPHSDEYTYTQLIVRDSQGELIENPTIIKEYFKNDERFDGSMVTGYNPMGYIFDSDERISIESDPLNQEFFNKTGVGYSWWTAENAVNGDYTFHVIVSRDDGDGWIRSQRCAIVWDLNFVANNGNMEIKNTNLYWGTIEDVSDTVSPIQQNKLGVSADSVSCKDDFVLAIKSSDRQPACLWPETKQKLIERGWAEPTIKTEAEMIQKIMSSPAQGFTEEESEFIAKIAMTDYQVQQFVKKHPSWDYSCCGYKINSPTDFKPMIIFSDENTTEELHVLVDLDKIKVISTVPYQR